jgi:Ca2+-binding EF-hand superfamily protein
MGCGASHAQYKPDPSSQDAVSAPMSASSKLEASPKPQAANTQLAGTLTLAPDASSKQTTSTQLADSSLPGRSTLPSLDLVDLTPSDIQRMFDDADADKSGKVSRQEFRNYLGADKYKAMFKLNLDDANHDGKLSFDEFLSAMWLRPFFDNVDVDLSGQLSTDEVLAYFRSQGKNKMAAIFAMNRSDADKDRKISFEEFKNMVYLRPVFDEVDKENTGKVKIRELKQHLRQKGRTQMDSIFPQDEEMEIDYAEFEKAMCSLNADCTP